LIEVELGNRFAPFRIVNGGLIPIEGFHHRRGSGRRDRRGRGGFADVEQSVRRGSVLIFQHAYSLQLSSPWTWRRPKRLTARRTVLSWTPQFAPISAMG
jgi:hypothetical protein